jgi:DegV family protein with EDD domain
MMGRAATAIAYLDGPRLLKAISAGVRLVFRRRDYLNRINVFPVPDGDTGTNMAFTFKTILDATAAAPSGRVDELMAQIADAALDGARGNSGAIMAQYFHGFSEAISGARLLTASGLAKAAEAGAAAAWKAMSQPVPGTLPTVLEDFSRELAAQVADGVRDIRLMLQRGLDRAHRSLANTPNQLTALRQAGVVDAGGQGFVDLLEGIWAFIEHGTVAESQPEVPAVEMARSATPAFGQHRYCTECVIAGAGLDREAIMSALAALDSSSLVVAGGNQRVRVHVHVDSPAEVFLACAKFGQITQQKADDMKRQHGLMNQPGSVAIVTDSGADIPPAEVERLGIHVVPVRLSFGDREFLDGVSLSATQFYDMLAESTEAPLTSQPPAQDFARVYALLTSHGYEVISVGLSAQLSGTTAAAIQAAGRQPAGRVRVVDSRSATAGQGLLAVAAAEAAELGYSADEIEALLSEWLRITSVVAVADDLSAAVKGGRVPAWVKRLTDLLHINPVLMASSAGKLTLAGFHRGRGANPAALARSVVRRMKKDRLYRVLIAHANHPQGAEQLRGHILQRHGQIHSCHVTEAGPAIGVHLGPGGLIVGFMQHPEVLQ